MTTPSVHNPTNFDPADYEVIEYLDNEPPKFMPFFGGDYDECYAEHRREVEFWRAENARLLGPDWADKVHRCVHCGNGRVRWITVAEHKPTGEHVVFGAVCTARLSLPDKHAFKLARLKAKDEAFKVRIALSAKVTAFMADHPVIAEAVEAIKRPEHAGNTFVKDLLSKLGTWGSLSDKQVAAIKPSLERDLTRAAAPVEVKVDAPEGRLTVTGTVVSKKWHANAYGETLKATVKFSTDKGIWLAWGTVPSGASWERGDTVTFTATFTRGDRDASFGFFKRPIAITTAAVESAAA